MFRETDKDGSGQIDMQEFMVLMENIDNAWIRVQKKTFTRWSNTVLSERMMKVEELSTNVFFSLLRIAAPCILFIPFVQS